MSGTAEKMLEYFLETYICVHYEEGDTSLDDFLSTYVIFMPINQICARLISIYKSKPQQRLGETLDLVLQEKVKVIRFLVEWYDASAETFLEDPKISTFLEVSAPNRIDRQDRRKISFAKELHHLVRIDSKIYPQLREEIKLIEAMMGNSTSVRAPTSSVFSHISSLAIRKNYGEVDSPGNNVKVSRNRKWFDLPMKVFPSIKRRSLSLPSSVNRLVICKVYCADHTYTTMKMRIDTPASKIIRIAAEKLGLRSDQPDDLKLCEVKSTGGENSSFTDREEEIDCSSLLERTAYKESDLSISYGLSLNGRLFLSPAEHLDALVSEEHDDDDDDDRMSFRSLCPNKTVLREAHGND